MPISSSPLTPLKKGLFVSKDAMNAQNTRMLVIAQNLANATVNSTKGNLPYRRKIVFFENAFNPKIDTDTIMVSHISADQTPFPKIYSPGDPEADSEGFIYKSNVEPFVELADMRETVRAHEANLRCFEKILSMVQSTIALLKS
ncbi:MAG: flagellar basal body rod protein FlgC [Alphaproteobacteria bacterium]